jgi:hypothetical protein
MGQRIGGANRPRRGPLRRARRRADRRPCLSRLQRGLRQCRPRRRGGRPGPRAARPHRRARDRLTTARIARLNRAADVEWTDDAWAGLAALAELDPELPRYSAVAAYLRGRGVDTVRRPWVRDPKVNYCAGRSSGRGTSCGGRPSSVSSQDSQARPACSPEPPSASTTRRPGPRLTSCLRIDGATRASLSFGSTCSLPSTASVSSPSMPYTPPLDARVRGCVPVDAAAARAGSCRRRTPSWRRSDTKRSSVSGSSVAKVRSGSLI